MTQLIASIHMLILRLRFRSGVRLTDAGMADFFRRGKSRAFFVPTIALPAAPTAAEINAGTDLSPKVNSLEGFVYENQPIDSPKMNKSFTPTIPGPDTVARSTITFAEDTTTNALRTTLAKGTVGYLVMFPAGTAGANPAVGDKCDIWPVIVTGKPRNWGLGNDPATWHAGFTPSDTPTEDFAIAA